MNSKSHNHTKNTVQKMATDGRKSDRIEYIGESAKFYHECLHWLNVCHTPNSTWAHTINLYIKDQSNHVHQRTIGHWKNKTRKIDPKYFQPIFKASTHIIEEQQQAFNAWTSQLLEPAHQALIFLRREYVR